MKYENIRHKIWEKKKFTLHHNIRVPLDFQNRGFVSGKAGLQQYEVNTGMSNGTSGNVVQKSSFSL